MHVEEIAGISIRDALTTKKVFSGLEFYRQIYSWMVSDEHLERVLKGKKLQISNVGWGHFSNRKKDPKNITVLIDKARSEDKRFERRGIMFALSVEEVYLEPVRVYFFSDSKIKMVK